MNKAKKLISLLLASVLLALSVLPSMAQVTDETSFRSFMNNGKGLYLAPGADNTEMNFSWYGGADGVTPTVRISKNVDMSGAKTFSGTVHANSKIERSNHVTVTGLEEGKTYYYVCCDGTTDTPVNSFQTITGSADFSAVYVSDIHITGDSPEDPALYESTQRFCHVLDEATSRADISLILSGGDQATTANPWEYYGMTAPDELQSIPMATAVGNHDVKRQTFSAVANYPNMQTQARSGSLVHGDYYFVKGNALFLVLDSTNSSAADHYEFVKNAVEAHPEAKWRVMMFHHDLFGGHHASRESENKLLRILFTPIIDAFAIDLVLTGHSHCYSRSHIIYGREISQNTSGLDSVTDPAGTIYLTSGTLRVNSEPTQTEPIRNSDMKSEFIDTDYLTETQSIYNILSFTQESLTIRSYATGDDEAFHEFTIVKTSQQGGHPKKSVPFWYPFVKYCGTLYNMINNVSRLIEINKRG